MKTPDENLLAVLAECAAACNYCSTACLKEEDVKMMSACIRLDMDCSQICSVTADFVSRGSDHAVHLLKECVEICEKCAEECGKHKHMDHCRACADACKNCATACTAALKVH